MQVRTIIITEANANGVSCFYRFNSKKNKK